MAANATGLLQITQDLLSKNPENLRERKDLIFRPKLTYPAARFLCDS